MDIFSLFGTTGVEILLILILTAALSIISRILLKNLKKNPKLPAWLKTLCSSFYFPIAWFIWVWGLLYIVQVSTEAADLPISSDIFGKIRGASTILFITWIILSWNVKYQKILKNQLDRTSQAAQDWLVIVAIGKVITIAVLLVSALLLLGILGIQVTALLAVGGVGGIALGFAAKDLFANIFGGFMIHFNRHFYIGEWISSPNKNFEGAVEEIGWYMTRISTLSNTPVFIPNSIFIEAIIENRGRKYSRQIKHIFGLRYEDAGKLQEIVKEIRSMLQNHPLIDQEKNLYVNLIGYSPTNALNIEVNCYTTRMDLGEWRDVQQGILLKMIEIVTLKEAEFAYQTTTVNLFDQS